MKILACFKVTRDFEAITPPELCELRDGVLNLSVFKKVIGGYDEAALENARRLALCVPQSAGRALHAATVGECEPRFAKELYAVGFDEVLRIRSPHNRDCGPEETAAHLSALVRSQGGYDVIMTGRQAWPGESGLVPYLLAQRLSFPCVSEVIDLGLCPGGVRVVSKTDSGTLARTVKVPAVYILGEALHPYLQIATLREKLAAAGKVVREAEAQAVLPRTDLGQVTRLLYENEEKPCRFLPGDTAREQAQALWREVLTKP